MRYLIRFDLDDLPPIPEGFVRVYGPGGSIHDIPEINLEKALDQLPDAEILIPMED
jgi:hypothetical protein